MPSCRWWGSSCGSSRPRPRPSPACGRVPAPAARLLAAEHASVPPRAVVQGQTTAAPAHAQGGADDCCGYLQILYLPHDEIV